MATARGARGWTQEELAKRTNGVLGRGYVAALETGAISKPGAKVFLALSAALNVPLSELHQAAGLSLSVASPRRESTRDLLERALLLTPIPVPVRSLATYGKEDYTPLSTHPDVYLSASTTRGHKVAAYLLSGDYPNYGLSTGSVVIVDQDASIEEGDLILFITPEGDPTCGTVRRVAGELWANSPTGTWPFRDVTQAAPVIQDVHVRTRPERQEEKDGAR